MKRSFPFGALLALAVPTLAACAPEAGGRTSTRAPAEASAASSPAHPSPTQPSPTQPSPTQPSPAGPGGETCGEPDWLASLQGKPADPIAAERRAEGRPVRVVRPGQAVTLEFAPRRLTLVVTEQGVITEAACR